LHESDMRCVDASFHARAGFRRLRRPRKGGAAPVPAARFRYRRQASCRFSTCPCALVEAKDSFFHLGLAHTPALLILAPCAILALATAKLYALCLGSLQAGVHAARRSSRARTRRTRRTSGTWRAPMACWYRAPAGRPSGGAAAVLHAGARSPSFAGGRERSLEPRPRCLGIGPPVKPRRATADGLPLPALRTCVRMSVLSAPELPINPTTHARPRYHQGGSVAAQARRRWQPA
jgi:hypothetical protein